MVILFTSTFMTLKSLLKAAEVVLADLSYSLLLATVRLKIYSINGSLPGCEISSLNLKS